MFPSQSMENIKRFRANEPNIVFNGMWSILLTGSAYQSADFATRHFKSFNNVSVQQWHLAICAQPHEYFNRQTHRDNGKWIADEGLPKISATIRSELKATGRTLPELYILFFDPYTTKLYRDGFNEKNRPVDNYSATAVVLELDGTRIGNEAHYKTGFEKAHEQIMKALDGKEHRSIASSEYGELLVSLNVNLHSFGFRSVLIGIGNVLLSTAFSTAVSVAFPKP